jgi:hypothetical protein
MDLINITITPITQNDQNYDIYATKALADYITSGEPMRRRRISTTDKSSP